jgi:Ni,Fe-hydrogenase I small subunit
MRIFFTVLFLLVSLISSSQKIKLKDEVVLVDDVAWLKYDGCTGFKYQTCSLINNNNDEIIFFKFIVRGTDNMVFNKGGDPNYYVVSFLGLNKKLEIRELTKDIIKIIYNAKVVNADGTLNEEKVDRLVEKYGSSFSSEVTNTNTIIIKEEPRGSGININIGR